MIKLTKQQQKAADALLTNEVVFYGGEGNFSCSSGKTFLGVHQAVSFAINHKSVNVAIYCDSSNLTSIKMTITDMIINLRPEKMAFYTSDTYTELSNGSCIYYGSMPNDNQLYVQSSSLNSPLSFVYIDDFGKLSANQFKKFTNIADCTVLLTSNKYPDWMVPGDQVVIKSIIFDDPYIDTLYVANLVLT